MKKYSMMLLFFGVILAFANPVFAVSGDVTGDAKVDITDAIRGMQIVEQIDPTGQTINIHADVNSDGKIGMDEVVFTLQKIAGLRPASLAETPVVMTSPDKLQYPFPNIYTFSGTVSPEVAFLSCTLNGGVSQPISAISDGFFNTLLTLKVGANTICTKASDSAGVVFSESCFTVVYDPVMVTSEPFSLSKSYTLSGMVYPSVVSSLSYRLNGGASTDLILQNMVAFSSDPLFPLSLNPGENTICIRAANTAGGLISDSCSSVIWSPVGVTSGNKSASSHYDFAGSAFPEVASLNYTLNGGAGQAITVSGGDFGVPLVLAPGVNTICVRATDAPNAAGNVLSDFCWPVLYAPFTITSAGYVTATSYAFTGTISSQEVISMTYALNGGTDQPVDLSGGSFSVPMTLIPGANAICTTTTANTGGGAGKSCFNVTYDTGRPSSLALIAQARNAGTINAEQALIYKAYAAVADPRLPAQFQGDDTFVDYAVIPNEIYTALPTLSAAAKEILGAFFIPPFYEGSWHSIGESLRAPGSHRTVPLDTYCNPNWPLLDNPCSRSVKWASVDGVHVRVWYVKSNETTDQPIAQDIVDLMESRDKVWDKLTAYMGRTPMSDDGFTYNGEDGRLDIALVDMAKEGLAVRRSMELFPGTKGAAPVYVLINRALSPDKIRFSAVHEFMHAIQHNTQTSLPKEKYYTLMESTAQWAGHLAFSTIDRNNKLDQLHANSYLKRTNEPFTFEGAPQFAYGLYLFPLYLSKTHMNSIVQEIWDLTGTSDQIRAIDRALNKYKTDFKTVWPKFALAVWNQGPVDKFREWDGMQKVPDKGDNLTPPGYSLEEHDVYPNNRLELNAELPAFSTRYHHFRFYDSAVRSVLFLNGVNFKLAEAKVRTSKGAEVTSYSAENVPNWTWTLIHGAKVQAIVKKGGVWKDPEDWSMLPYKAFCREVKEERIEELVLIFSAGDLSGKPFSPLGLKPMLWATDAPCGPGKFNAGINCTKEGGDTKSMTITDMDYLSGGWRAADGDKNDNTTFYTPIERSYGFSGGKIDWSAVQDGVSGAGSTTGDEAAALNLHTISFVQQGSGYKAYDVSGGISNLIYEFTKSCTSPPEGLDCSLNIGFTLKSSFDEKKKAYTRQVSGADIEPSGPGTDFSDEDVSDPVARSTQGRVPLDSTELCLCPGAPAGLWECSGSWSLIGRPEP